MPDPAGSQKICESLTTCLSLSANGTDVFYIDCTPYFGDEEGYMFDSITNDGIHPKVKYYKVWRDWMSYAFSTLGI